MYQWWGRKCRDVPLRGSAVPRRTPHGYWSNDINSARGQDSWYPFRSYASKILLRSYERISVFTEVEYLHVAAEPMVALVVLAFLLFSVPAK
jgi:hypothetical protein